MNITNNNVKQLLENIKKILTKNKMNSWFPNVSFLLEENDTLLWNLSKTIVLYYQEGVKCKLLGYRDKIPIRFTFNIYPYIIDGCRGCPPEFTRELLITDIEWNVCEVKIIGKRNILKKVNECCEYLKSNMEWFWTDIELDRLNDDLYDFCKETKKLTRKEKIAERYYK